MIPLLGLAILLCACPLISDERIDQARDADGDGFLAAGYGGEDCDDEDSSIHPEATESWYDGVDQDCDGLSDYDADQDLFESSEDCDDGDDTIYPGAIEQCDDTDHDCDGFAYNDVMVQMDYEMYSPAATSGGVTDFTAVQLYRGYSDAEFDHYAGEDGRLLMQRMDSDLDGDYDSFVEVAYDDEVRVAVLIDPSTDHILKHPEIVEPA